jgi:hypothetical protein
LAVCRTCGFALDQRPLEALLRAVHVEALAILPGDVVQEPPDVGGDVGVLDLDVADSTANLLPDFFCDVLADGARAEARDVLGRLVHQSQAGADDVRGVVHGDHPLPVLGPAVHVLRVRGRQVLDLAQFPLSYISLMNRNSRL